MLTHKTYSDVDDALDRIGAALAAARAEFGEGGGGASANKLGEHFTAIERAALDAIAACEWDYEDDAV
jgi:hypothetical protein